MSNLPDLYSATNPLLAILLVLKTTVALELFTLVSMESLTVYLNRQYVSTLGGPVLDLTVR